MVRKAGGGLKEKETGHTRKGRKGREREGKGGQRVLCEVGQRSMVEGREDRVYLLYKMNVNVHSSHKEKKTEGALQ